MELVYNPYMELVYNPYVKDVSEVPWIERMIKNAEAFNGEFLNFFEGHDAIRAVPLLAS